MMTVKKLTMVMLAAGSLTAGTLVACAHGGDHQRSPEKRIEFMKKELNLTDAQAAQIKTIYANNEAAFKADRDAMKAAADDNAKKAAFQKMRADREQVEAQVKAVLTADQQAKLAEKMKNHEGHGGWGGKHGDRQKGDAAPPAK
jgi:Spy/CpxP family protein refolding chaperone